MGLLRRSYSIHLQIIAFFYISGGTDNMKHVKLSGSLSEIP